MNNMKLNRRSFLKTAGRASGFVALSGGVIQLTSFNAWGDSNMHNHHGYSKFGTEEDCAWNWYGYCTRRGTLC